MEEKIVVMMLNHNIIKEQDREIYKYGLCTLKHKLISFAAAVVIALILRKLSILLLLLVCMMPIRRYAGGFHESSAVRCFIVSQLMFVAMELIVDRAASSDIGMIIALLGAAVGSIIIIKKAPVESVNRPLLERQVKKYRRIALVLCAVWNLAMVALYYCNMPRYVFVIALVLTVQGILLIIPEHKSKESPEGLQKGEV